MKDFDQKKTIWKKAQPGHNWLENRLVFDEKAPEGGDVGKDKPKPTLDVNSPDFDNKAFKTEKNGKFASNLDSAIRDTIMQVPELKDKTPEIEQLQKEFTTGMREGVLANKNNIAELIKTLSPKLYAEKDTLTNDTALSWFQNVLINLKCTKLGLVYDNTEDTTKFRFYSGNQEILFKNTDIKIQYVPKSLADSASTLSETAEQPKEFKVTSKEKVNKKTNAIDHVAIMEKNVGRKPVEGERVVVKRGYSELKATFREKDQQFHTEDKLPLWLITGDKVTFYPKQKEKPEMLNQVELDGTPYIVLTQIDTKSSYLDVAKAVLNYTTGQGAVMDGKQFLDDDTCARIIRTNISAPEYAALLKAAHEKVGKSNRLPIIMPISNLERKHEKQTKKEKQEAEKVASEAKVASEGELKKILDNGLQVIRQVRTPKEMSEISNYLWDYQAKITAAATPEKKQELINDLLSYLDNYYNEAGIKRTINKGLENAMAGGKDSDTWRELWTKENPTVNKVMSVIDAHPDIFGKTSKNAVRGIVFDMINTGNASTFDSEDIIKYFKIKLPDNQAYDAVLGLAAAPDATDPALKERQVRYRRIVSAIEGLGDSIEAIDPGKSTEFKAAARQHEKLAENAEGGAKSLKKIIDLLNVDKSSAITKGTDGGFYSTIEKGGKRVMLKVREQGTGQYISAHDPDSGEQLWEEWDNFGFDAQDYVSKINATLEKSAKAKKGEKAGEKLETIKLNNVEPAYYSLSGLETLSQGVPGVPAKELLEITKEKNQKLIDNKLANNVRQILNALGIMDTAKIVDTPENLKNLKENNEVYLNLRYKGKDITLWVENPTGGWNVKAKPGFNQDANNGDFIFKATLASMDIKMVTDGLDAVIHNEGYENAQRLITKSNVDKVAILGEPIAELNKLLSDHSKAIKYQGDLSLSAPQVMEVVFRAFSFDELKKMGLIKKVEGKDKNYVLTGLPPAFKSIGGNQDLLNLVYAVKYGQSIDKTYRGVISGASEKARESASESAKYENRLKKIFAYGLTDFDEKGRKVTMSDVDTKGGTVTDYTKDEYFKKVSGKAAYEDFYEQVRTRNDKGEEVIDLGKANTRLNEMYQKGLVKLNQLARQNTAYADLQKQVTKSVQDKKIDLNKDLTDLEQKIVRLGYLADTEMKEQDQSKALDKFKEQLVENILKLLPDKVTGPDGQVLNKDQMQASLKELPIGILVSYSYNADKSHNVGVHMPIILDVFGVDYAKLVIMPGLGAEGLGGPQASPGLRLAVGVSFTSKDPAKDQDVIFFGGVSVGMGASFSGASFGPAIGGGVDFRIVKADEVDNYNHYLGIRTGVGFDIVKGQFGLNIGPAYKWEIDAQKKYQNSLREAFEKEGIKTYIDELKDIYQKGSDKKAIDAFAVKIKNNPALAPKLGITATSSNEETLIAFEQYVAGFIENFNEQFDLPTVVGGEIGFSVVDGAIMAIGASTGNVPLLLGGIASWGIQVLASLKFNVGSRMVIERERKTSEKEMQTFNDLEKQKQFDKAFEGLPKSAKAAELYTSGRNTLDAKGEKRTSMVEVNSASAEVAADGLGKKIDEFNKTLLEKKIDLRLKKNEDNTIEIVLLDSKLAANEKFLISPNLAVTKGDRIFLRDPNNIQFLYFDRQTRKYPLETSHGATMETITTISDNRFYKGDSFPTEISITRFADAKDSPTITGKEGKAEAYVDTAVNFHGVSDAQKRMKGALDKSSGIESEPVRDKMKDLAKKIYFYANKKGDTFLKITSAETKKNLDNPDYLSEKLYSFYDDYAKDKKLPAFNGREKQVLTLELSTLRYTQLLSGAEQASDRAKIFRDRLEWAKGTLVPYFERRIAELKKAGKEVKHTAKELADKAVKDLMYLDLTMKPTALKEGTSVAVAIGRGGNGLHQMLDGSRDKSQPQDVDPYGYIMGKDYTEALKTGQPVEDYEIAMILMGQLSQLPERSNVKGFMDSNLSRKLASNGGLAFILGKDNYDKVINYYQTGSGDAAGLSKFMDIVEQIRKAQSEGKEVISVTGDKGVKFLMKISTKIQSGVFNKCGNYTSTINEEIAIIPPSQEEAMMLLASGSESRTTLNTKAYKQFLGLFGGVTATVSLDFPGGGGGGSKPKEEAGQKGETKTGSGDRESNQNTTPSQGPGTNPDVPPTEVNQGGGEAL